MSMRRAACVVVGGQPGAVGESGGATWFGGGSRVVGARRTEGLGVALDRGLCRRGGAGVASCSFATVSPTGGQAHDRENMLHRERGRVIGRSQVVDLSIWLHSMRSQMITKPTGIGLI